MANEWDLVIKKVNDAIRSDKAVRSGIQTVLAVQKQRIFARGEDGSEGQIGTYSTNPISISKKNQVRNTGQTYFPGGYAQYKALSGRDPSIVNLQNTGQMFQDYSFHILGADSYGLGFNNPFNYEKSQWMEKHFNKEIFQQSDYEGEVLTRTIEQEIGRDLR